MLQLPWFFSFPCLGRRVDPEITGIFGAKRQFICCPDQHLQASPAASPSLPLQWPEKVHRDRCCKQPGSPSLWHPPQRKTSTTLLSTFCTDICFNIWCWFISAILFVKLKQADLSNLLRSLWFGVWSCNTLSCWFQIYCRDDRVCICPNCEEEDHQGHNAVKVEDEWMENKVGKQPDVWRARTVTKQVMVDLISRGFSFGNMKINFRTRCNL